MTRTWLALGTVLLTTACGPPAYIPDVTLSPEHRTIDAVVELHSLYPSPVLLTGKARIGLATSSDKPVAVGPLVEKVEAAVLEELQASGIFTRVARFDPQPDFILSGRINALHEHYRPHIWTYLPWVDALTSLFDLKSYVSSGKADLTMYLLKPNGELVGTYRGISKFYESFHPTSEMPPGARLNQALSEAVQQIQDKISHDAQVRTVASR